MEFLKRQPAASSRLGRGNALLAGAQQVDTAAVRERLNRFLDLHRAYLVAQSAVEEAQALEAAQQQQVDLLDGDLGRAITGLAAALLLDGESMRNTFGRFCELGPRAMMRLPYLAYARAVLDLAASLRASLGVSAAALVAADTAERAARRLEDGVAGLELRRTYTRQVRYQRDALNPQWDSAYTALRYLGKSLIEHRDLYRTLFPYTRRQKADAPVNRASHDSATASTEVETPPSVAAEAAVARTDENRVAAVVDAAEPLASSQISAVAATSAASSGETLRNGQPVGRREGGRVIFLRDRVGPGVDAAGDDLPMRSASAEGRSD